MFCEPILYYGAEPIGLNRNDITQIQTAESNSIFANQRVNDLKHSYELCKNELIKTNLDFKNNQNEDLVVQIRSIVETQFDKENLNNRLNTYYL